MFIYSNSVRPIINNGMLPYHVSNLWVDKMRGEFDQL